MRAEAVAHQPILPIEDVHTAWYLRMTAEGIVKRDLMVVDACVARGVPVVMTLGGGYSKNAWHAQYLSIKEILKTHGPQ